MKNINFYFKNTNLDVCYDTLNNNDFLIRSYIKEFEELLNDSSYMTSNFIKHDIYSKLYDFVPRPKLTGFESFDKLEKEFRNKIINHINKSNQLTIGKEVPKDNSKELTELKYKEQLKRKVKEFTDPLLYYSGGLDSELVAMAMLDAGVKFTPVIFEYIDNDNFCKNTDDIKYAYNFCQKHNLTPIIKTLNLEELWNSKEFFDLAVDLDISSPQIVTHAFMIKIMSHEYSNRSHVFGGEVNFENNNKINKDDPLNIVYLNKIFNPMWGIDGLVVLSTGSVRNQYSVRSALYMSQGPDIPNYYRFRSEYRVNNIDYSDYYPYYILTNPPPSSFYFNLLPGTPGPFYPNNYWTYFPTVPTSNGPALNSEILVAQIFRTFTEVGLLRNTNRLYLRSTSEPEPTFYSGFYADFELRTEVYS